LCVALTVSAAVVGGCGGGQPPNDVTFWRDVAPIYNTKCVRCHQNGGIAPFALDDYADAKAYASLELAQVTAGTMPPYFLVHDDSCGSFHDEATLTDAEKSTIAAWVNGARAEGTPVTLTIPPLPKLDDALDVATPTFAPVAQGTALAKNDEYRCFPLDPPISANAFLTGYDVAPGEPSIVHHVIVFLVDPNATGQGGMTNAAIMQSLDDQSPDRLGWDCFGAAGDGVKVSAVPVTWAPGQGVVTYPDGMGIQIKPTDKLVVQVHYNLTDPTSPGKTDSTTVHLRFADTVDRQLVFALPDPFLASLGNATPDSLPPGQPDAKYTWTKTAADFAMMSTMPVLYADLIAVLPHMHGRGLRQTFMMGPTGNLACASHLEHWDFHWQEVYFYKTPPRISAGTQFQVTCEYDTSADTEPVLPGWGTQNEMCLLGMIIALPPS
jgi:hypothetical protein